MAMLKNLQVTSYLHNIQREDLTAGWRLAFHLHSAQLQLLEFSWRLVWEYQGHLGCCVARDATEERTSDEREHEQALDQSRKCTPHTGWHAQEHQPTHHIRSVAVVSNWLVMEIDYVQREILWLYRPLMVWLSRGTAVDKYLKRLALPQSRPHNWREAK